MSDDDLDDLLGESRGKGRRPGMPIDPGRLLASVKRDWRWIPIAAAIWAALGLLVALLFIGHTYKAQTAIVWEPKGGEQNNQASQNQLATEAGSLKLPGAIRKIRQRLKLSATIETLQKQIEVTFNPQSNLVTIDADGATARESAVLANTVVAVFMDQQTEIVRARAEDTQRALEKDIRVTQAKLEAARSTYDTYRAENGFSDIELETKDAVANLAKLKEEQQQAPAEIQNLTSQIAALEERKKHEPNAIIMPGTTNATKIAELESKVRVMRGTLSADHPDRMRAEAELQALRASGGTEPGIATANPQVQTIAAAISTFAAQRDGLIARRKEIEESLLPKAEQRAAWYRSLEGTARAYLADIDLNEKRLVELQSQISKARDAARTPQVEWRVLAPAVEPEWPERSKRRWVVAGMPVLGMIVALLTLLIRPLLDGRVYTAREAGYWCNAPVLASTTWPRNSEMLYPLADELIHHGALAPGYTLVVGASPREKAHAEELAYWLGGGERRRVQSNPAGPVHVTAAPSGGVHAAGGGHSGDVATASAGRRDALMRVPQQAASAALAQVPQGTHAWLGNTDGPSLRRASRMADRVIVLLTSGTEVFTEVAGLRTRLGREGGVGIVMLGMNSELLKLPDRVGDVDAFWANRA